MTYPELLMTSLILSMVAAAGLATWGLAGRVPANKRVNEMGVAIAVQELERMKAMTFSNLAPSALDGSGNPVPTVRWYDKDGTWLGTAASTGAYKVKAAIVTLINRDGTTNSEDLRELRVEVWNAAETSRYESARTLLTFGGV